MRLLFIRHGDPDYEHDTLTEKGWREAEFLAERMERTNIQYFYVSPLGRARDTASLTLEKVGRPSETCDWLREFEAPIWRPDCADRRRIPWDWLPQDWTEERRLYLPDRWREQEAMEEGEVGKEYDRVTSGMDRLLASHGYVREGRYYRAERPNHDTLAFFCHFGVGCVLIGHLLGISPVVLWHGLCAAPTSVSTVMTEERRKGIASFRMTGYGDISHLYAHGEEPSASARFCECFDDADQRHD